MTGQIGMEKRGTGKGPAGNPFAGVVVMTAAMTMFGLAPLLFGGLAEEKRLALSQVGLAIPIQAFIMALINLGADVVLKRRRQRVTTLVCIVVLALLQLLYVGRSGTATLILCALCSVPQGLLLWISMGVIAQSATPARLMAYSEIMITLLKLLVSSVLVAIMIPRWGIDSGFAMAAVIICLGFFAVLSVPDNICTAVGHRKQETSALSARAWVALAVVMLVWNGTMSLISYLLPLASSAGLSAQDGHRAFVALLLGQISGGFVAAAISKRMPYSFALGLGSLMALGAILVFQLQIEAWQFWGASAAFGFTFAFSAPFLMPMLIMTDPSKKAASKFMGAALFGSASGPLLSSRVVGLFGAQAALYTACGAVVLAIFAVTLLRMTDSSPSCEPGAENWSRQADT